MSDEQKALILAERYGIINYYVNDGYMIYYEDLPLEENKYKGSINLNTMDEQRQRV